MHSFDNANLHRGSRNLVGPGPVENFTSNLENLLHSNRATDRSFSMLLEENRVEPKSERRVMSVAEVARRSMSSERGKMSMKKKQKHASRKNKSRERSPSRKECDSRHSVTTTNTRSKFHPALRIGINDSQRNGYKARNSNARSGSGSRSRKLPLYDAALERKLQSKLLLKKHREREWASDRSAMTETSQTQSVLEDSSVTESAGSGVTKSSSGYSQLFEKFPRYSHSAQSMHRVLTNSKGAFSRGLDKGTAGLELPRKFLDLNSDSNCLSNITPSENISESPSEIILPDEIDLGGTKTSTAPLQAQIQQKRQMD